MSTYWLLVCLWVHWRVREKLTLVSWYTKHVTFSWAWGNWNTHRLFTFFTQSNIKKLKTLFKMWLCRLLSIKKCHIPALVLSSSCISFKITFNSHFVARTCLKRKEHIGKNHLFMHLEVIPLNAHLSCPVWWASHFSVKHLRRARNFPKNRSLTLALIPL